MKRVITLLTAFFVAAAVLTLAAFATAAVPAIAAGDDYILLGDMTPEKLVTLDDGLSINETGMDPGKGLKIGGTKYAKGISFHPFADRDSYIIYDIEGAGYKTFYAVVGKDESAGRVAGYNAIVGTAVNAKVYVDGQLAADSGKLPFPEVYEFKVNVEGAKKVKIVLGNGGDSYYCDTSSWANAMFSKQSPAEFTLPAEIAATVETPSPTPSPSPAPTNPPDIRERQKLYLSDMAWTAAENYPSANYGVPARDANFANELLFVGTSYFPKGVCMHGNEGKNAFIEVSLDGLDYLRFGALCGVAYSEAHSLAKGSVRFVFIANGKEIYRTDLLKADGKTEKVFLDVTGVKTFRIEMEDGGDGVNGDWGVLGLAAFAKTEGEDPLFEVPEMQPTESQENAAVYAPHRLSAGIIVALILAVLAVVFAAVFVVAKVRKAKGKKQVRNL
ncbi:MAG: NPCBM/NEW2 domain-containing protein [Clostridia bacterium]|nr:NPCBM/NEW2 domain-containing protein [Clostridia bacterium]